MEMKNSNTRDYLFLEILCFVYRDFVFRHNVITLLFQLCFAVCQL